MTYETAVTVATILFFTTIVLLLAYYLAPVGECDKCDHCRNVRLERKRKDEAARHEYEHHWGLNECTDDSCPAKEKPE